MKKKKGTSSVSSAAKKATKKPMKKAAPAAKRGPVMPLGDRVLLKPLSAEDMATKTASGILIPETVSKEKPEQGTVIAVGPGRIGDDHARIPVSVEVGDRVVFSKYGYDEVKVDGVEYYLVSEQNILAVIPQK
jgi:chaperonin GroES